MFPRLGLKLRPITGWFRMLQGFLTKNKMEHHETYHFPKTFEAWKKEVLNAFEIMKLNVGVMTVVKGDEKATIPAVFFMLAVSLASALNQVIFPVKVMGIVIYTPDAGTVLVVWLGGFVGLVLGCVIMNFVAQKLFRGKAKFIEFLRVSGYAALLGVVSILPVVGIVAGLWGLVVLFKNLKIVHKLTDGGAVGTMVISIIGLIVVYVAWVMVVGIGMII